MKKIAIPMAEGELCMHFGHCQQFRVFNIENEAIASFEDLTPPPHEPGVIPAFLAEHNVNLIIAGGMGSRAQNIFTQHDIQVVVGASGKPEELVQHALNGSLVSGANCCDH